MSNMINFTIDGEAVSVEAGKTILYAANQIGINIPTLCYNSKVSKSTSCFVCVVKDAKSGRFLPSCAFIPNEGQEIESETAEVKEMRQSALNLLLSEHTGDCEAPCTVACPAHACVEEYVREGKKGEFLESLKLIKERIPLPMSIGRVCPRFCEKDCRRNIGDKPVAINDFKRLAADLHYDEYMEPCDELTGKTVAIIGGGPAGLSTAYFLRRKGIASVIFEKMPKAGGMLRYGIPEYRLPKAILDRELSHFDRMGDIKINCNQELGKDFTLEQLKKDYDAVAVTIGCWKASSMRTEGEELASEGIVWLEKIALAGWSGENPGKTIVIGGGNTAMDCVRTSVRLGSDNVSCFYRRTEAEMPAEEIEIKEAKEEGVIFEFLTAPISLRKEGDKLILTCLKMELGEPDASGRRRPIPIEGSEYEVEADTIIAAIGQKTDAPEGLITNKWGDIAVDEATQAMSEGVFSAGDCVTGAATVVEATAGARKIACAISDYIDARPHEEPALINVSRGHWRSLGEDALVHLKDPVKDERLGLPHISIEDRKSTFEEVTATPSCEEITAEGTRCYECSCTAKGECKLKEHSESYGAKPDAIAGDRHIVTCDTRHPSIIHDRMKCIKCGICIKVCSEIVNQNLLGMKNRGFFSEVGPAYGKALPDSCSDCGACIPECPVGALDWKDKEK